MMLLIMAIAAALVPTSARADIRLPALIGDNMVLQSDAEARIWGWADPGEEVTVSIQGQSVSTAADADGRWALHLAPMPRSDEPVEMTVSGKNEVTVRNILIGEVWVCAGQSNMWWPVSRTTNADREIAEANHPSLRLFTVPVRAEIEPVSDIDQQKADTVPEVPEPAVLGRWVECNPEVIADFSGTAYYFGRDLQRALDGAPVGIVSLAVGGTVVQAWTSKETLGTIDDGRSLIDYWDDYTANQYPHKLAAYEKELAAWEATRPAAADSDSTDAASGGEAPEPPLDATRYVNRYSALYNGMVAPLTPYTIRGATWYQGESNASSSVNYHKFLPAMVRDWRAAWDLGAIPFVIVQLPNLDTSLFTSLGKGDDWPIIREAQAQTASDLDNVGLTVTIDIGKADDAHPPNKPEVAERMVLTAEALAYGRESGYSGPMFESMTIDGHEAYLRFNHASEGLTARDGELRGFEVAGADHRYVNAQARIEGESVVVWSDAVALPVAVRYAWKDNPDGNLYNAAGLPAAPFRTDDVPPSKTTDARIGSFDGAAAGFWGSVGAPAGWESSDPTQTYTTTTGFVILPAKVTATAASGKRVQAGTRYQLNADIGGDEGTTATVTLVATQHADGSGTRMKLLSIDRPGIGNYHREPVTSAPERVSLDALGYHLRYELTVSGTGTGYFDNITVTPVTGE